MGDTAQKPKIRFPGFTDSWERCKLGDIGSVAMCRRIFKHQTSVSGEIPFFKIGTFGGVPDAFISRALFEEFKAKYPYPEKGDILISASGSIGRTVEYMGENEYFQDSNIVWLKHDKSITNPFLKHLYETIKWAGIEGSTIKRLYNDNILKTEVVIPSVPEQIKIAEILDSVDNLITLHQRKLDTLKEYKKGLLQKMFPRDGASVPEIRFSGFSDPWERCTLGEVFEQTFNFVNPNDQDIELWSLTVVDGLTPKSERYNREFLVKKEDIFKEVRPGDIVYNPMNMTLGAVGYNGMAKSVAVSGYYTTMIAKEDIDAYYMNLFLI